MKLGIIKNLFFFFILILIYFSNTLSYAASEDVSEPKTNLQETHCDPLEKFNRVMFNLNDKLDTYIFKPVAILYDKIVPKPLNRGIHNAFSNINTLPTIGNDILQLHFYQMTCDLWRLALNTTVGIGGLFDVATSMGLNANHNDFGLTLARWGWERSIYLVLPIFGPNTFRDGIEIPVDYYAFSIYPYLPETATYVLYPLSAIDRRAQLLKLQDVMEEAALDKYSFVRSAYFQRRNYQIEQNKKCYKLSPPPGSRNEIRPDPGYLRLGN